MRAIFTVFVSVLAVALIGTAFRIAGGTGIDGDAIAAPISSGALVVLGAGLITALLTYFVLVTKGAFATRDDAVA